MGRPCKFDNTPLLRDRHGVVVWAEDYEKVIALSEELGLNLQQTTEKVLAEHKRGVEGKFRRPPTHKTQNINLTDKGFDNLKELKKYYGGTAGEIMHYVLETMEGD